jgi:hypothetical protein
MGPHKLKAGYTRPYKTVSVNDNTEILNLQNKLFRKQHLPYKKYHSGTAIQGQTNNKSPSQNPENYKNEKEKENEKQKRGMVLEKSKPKTFLYLVNDILTKPLTTGI